MFTIPNFQMVQPLYDSENSLVYRAIRSLDQRPVILKWSKADFPTVTQLARYQHEYELLTHLTLPGVIQVYSLENWQEHLILVLEDFGGESLIHWLKQRTFTVTECLSLAIQMADSLGQIHAANVIHKDINPANLVWNPTTGQLKLIDFGIATRLPRETLSLQNPNQLEGTLPYLSPEQTGRMNRALDYRTDLYSLGVMFYELFTGRLPFESQEAMELVHCHLAKQPIPPHQVKAEVPSVISHLILRLMAKAAEERYQSAWGIKADLEQILVNLTNLQDLSNFTLGQYDFSDQFHLPQKLYGRAAELQQLLTAFENVSTGQSQLLLVAGYSGIGKTALVQEIYKPITEKRGYFIAGKFDQFQRNLPYSAMVQAFRDLVRQLLTETQAQLDDWKTAILTAVGNNGQVIIDVISEVELILGPQPAVPTLPPTESQNRFNLVFQNFIQVFCQAEHPLVIFLDDLQWIDSASLKLMTLMMSDIPYLLLIGAYRDNEVSPVHPLMTTLEEMQKQGLLVQTLTLTPLTLAHLNQLVSDTLHLPLVQTLPLAELVLAKTGGNPFFVGEFLKILYVEQLLEFNAQKRQWQWDLARIQAHNITDNVVELMTGKIQRLPAPTQVILKLAASIGNQFDLDTVAMISQQAEEQVKIALWEALKEGLVVPLAENYKFVHDRVQQAAYSLIPERDRPALHWQIGQLLLPHDNTLVEERLFEIVDHLNLGIVLADTPATQMQLVRLNLQAGQKAKATIAYQVARNYLMIGLQLLPAESWQSDYELTFHLHLEMAEVEYLNRHFPQFDRWCDILLQHVDTLLDRVKTHELQLHAYIIQNQLSEAIEVGLQAINLLGISLYTPSDNNWLVELPALDKLADFPNMTDLYQLATMRIMVAVLPACYFSKPDIYSAMTFTMVNLCLKNGHSSSSAVAYSQYGLLLCGKFGNLQEGYHAGQIAIHLIEQFRAHSLKAKVYLLFNIFIRPWREHLKATLMDLREAIQSGLEVGDIGYAGYCAGNYCLYLFFTGESLGLVVRQQQEYIDFLKHLKHPFIVLVTAYRQLSSNLMLPTSPRGGLNGEYFNETEVLPYLHNTNNQTVLFAIYFAKEMLAYLFQTNTEMIKLAMLTEEYSEAGIGWMIFSLHKFYYSLILLANYPMATAHEQKRYLAQVTLNQEQMKGWVIHAPMNFQHKFDLVEAERYRILGDYINAMDYYDRAIAGAKKNEFLHEEAIANEVTARFYLGWNKDNIAQIYLTDAYYAYARWGAKAKVKDLEERYPHWLPPHRTAAPSVIPTFTTATLPLTSVSATRLATSTDWLDLTSVLKAAQTLSDEMVLENLLEKMMHTVIENAGAQRGVLILEDQGQWLIQAELTVQPETVTVLQAFSLTGRVPTTLLNYVIRTKQSAVFAELQREAKYQTDDYVRTQALKSVLCLTLLHQQKLVGVIYLENNLTTGAFTHDRFQVLTLLSSQMAISLDNARFVRELEQSRQVAEEARQAAEAANQAKTAFLANVSHELRTPLNGILGYVQLLEQSPQLLVKQQEYVKAIHRSGEHLLTLVSDIIDISKLQTAKLELQVTDVPLSPLLTELANWFHDQAQEKGLTFHYEPASHLSTGIIADGKRLRQILLHLLSNAVKFTQRGSIIFQVQSTPLPNRLGWHQFQFIVTDTGIGMTAADLSRLFTPFEQVSDWLHKSAGAGLGLSLAKQLVELMGGQIQVQSSPGQGSTFTVKLDLAESQEWQSVSTSARISDQSETSPRPVAQTLEEVTSPLKGPPADQAAELYELCQIGDFIEILQLVTQFEQADAELGPFVAKVRQLAKEFRDEAIEELARQFMTN